MATFTGTFKYVTEETYYVKVEAKTLEEALNLIEEDPFYIQQLMNQLKKKKMLQT